MKLVIPHIHRTLGDAGFFARISEKGEIKELRVKVLEGLRQIEGILIGRRVWETPLVISRVCGICPTSHILNACAALEKALGIKISLQTERLRKLITAAQIIQSHTGHAFFVSLVDERLSKESKALLELREFALKIIEMVGGRRVHPIRPRVGGFSKIPSKTDYQRVLKDYPKAYENGLALLDYFKKLEYPQLRRKTLFCSSFPYHKGERIKIGLPAKASAKAGAKLFSPEDFFFNQIEEDLKEPPAKKVKFRGKPYMLGPMARIKNNGLPAEARRAKAGAKLIDFENTFYNSLAQAVEIVYFLREIEKELKILIRAPSVRPFVDYDPRPGRGLAVLEAPRGTLFTYLGVDEDGRICDCTIITPTAQFLRNLEEDLRSLAPLTKTKVKTLIRAYDPCIACAVH